jgi:hypothetical protein
MNGHNADIPETSRMTRNRHDNVSVTKIRRLKAEASRFPDAGPTIDLNLPNRWSNAQ